VKDLQYSIIPFHFVRFAYHNESACRTFTPRLKTLYDALRARETTTTEPFEVVFVSLDKTDDDYANYSAQMPWWSLSLRASSTARRLAQYYGAATGGIPYLVVLDKDGTILVPDGVGQVGAMVLDLEEGDTSGLQSFPWRPPPLVELLPRQYIAAKVPRSDPPSETSHSAHSHQSSSPQQLRPMTNLDDKYLMLYFGAHWCPPCRGFTPRLVQAYTALKNSRNDFELLFVSSDHSQVEFDEYFAAMNFAAVPYPDRKAKTALSKRLQISSIPALCIFGPRPADGIGDRPLINRKLRPMIEQYVYSNNPTMLLQDFPYWPKPYSDLSQTTDNINLCRCVIVFHEGGDDEEQDETRKCVQQAATMYYNKKYGVDHLHHGGYSNHDLKFMWAVSPTGLALALRETLKLGPVTSEPILALLDLPDQGAFYKYEPIQSSQQWNSCHHNILTPESILAFVANPGTRREVS